MSYEEMIHDSPTTLLLSVARQWIDPSSVDVAACLEREARVDELSDALAHHLASRAGDSYGGYGNGLALHCERLGRLAPGDCVLDTGLRSGDSLTLVRGMRFTTKRLSVASEGMSSEAVVDLIVHAGPQAGLRVSLCPGSYVVGREPLCEGEIELRDRSVSRRHLQLEIDSHSVSISDLGSSNGFAVEGRTIEDTLRLTFDGSTQIEVGRSVIAFHTVADNVSGSGTIRDGATLFNRQPRVVEPYRAPHLALDPAPGEVTLGKLQLAGIFLPIAGGVSSAVIFGQWKLLLSVALSPATLLWTYVAERRSGRRLFHRSMAEYTQHLDALREELEQARTRECAARRAASPDAVELATRALQIRPELWERRSTDADFLSLRLGVADQPAEFGVDAPVESTSLLPAPAQQLLDAYRTVPMVPLTVELPRVGSLGLAGSDRQVDGLGLWLALQAAILHSPCELAIAAAIDADQRVQWDWLKWLPHTRGDLSALPGAHLADDPATTRDLLSRIAKLISERRRAAAAGDHPSHSGAPALTLFLDEDLAEERGVVEEILNRGPAVGVYTVWLGHLQRGLPGECRSIALLDPDIARLTFIRLSDDERIADVATDAVEQRFASTVARAIASVKDTSARGDGRRMHESQRERFPSAGNETGTEHQIVVVPFAWTDGFAAMRDSLNVGEID